MLMEQSWSEEMAMSVGGTLVYGTSNTRLSWSLWRPTAGALPFGQALGQDHLLPMQSSICPTLKPWPMTSPYDQCAWWR